MMRKASGKVTEKRTPWIRTKQSFMTRVAARKGSLSRTRSLRAGRTSMTGLGKGRAI